MPTPEIIDISVCLECKYITQLGPDGKPFHPRKCENLREGRVSEASDGVSLNMFSHFMPSTGLLRVDRYHLREINELVCRIAIATLQTSLLITDNAAYFRNIPGLIVEAY